MLCMYMYVSYMGLSGLPMSCASLDSKVPGVVFVPGVVVVRLLQFAFASMGVTAATLPYHLIYTGWLFHLSDLVEKRDRHCRVQTRCKKVWYKIDDCFLSLGNWLNNLFKEKSNSGRICMITGKCPHTNWNKIKKKEKHPDRKSVV